MYAASYASGLIVFGRSVPEGALPIAKGPARKLRPFIQAVARHGWEPNTLLVPGLPEAPNQDRAMTAFEKWLRWLGKTPPAGIVVNTRTRRSQFKEKA
jgi:hypothetical protein